ncbi:DUF3427 domain-containing protein [Sinorhizobium meliloti]|uniref:DUF3427 domain-containing protein n=1 Tax=Rhizobium meliloti TaxID=382 RepID=UPI00129800FB
MSFRGKKGQRYTRAQVQDILGVPEDRRGGDWATGYTQYENEFFIFCNIGVAGRTGHDYDNHWDGDILVWYGKRGSSINQPQIVKLRSGDFPVHIFHRSQDRTPFVYAGAGRVIDTQDTRPVLMRWSFAEASMNSEIADALAANGFRLDAPGVHTQRATRGDVTVYVKQLTTSFPLVIGPEWEQRLTELKLTGAIRPAKRVYYHNATMRKFPQRLNHGEGKIPYGLDFGFGDDRSLHNFLRTLTGKGRIPDQLELAKEPDVDPATETEVTRAARLGQQQFRSDLIERFTGRCALTDVDMLEALRASHIKPWSQSSPKEKRDPDNGILLAVHLDSLFDKGLISFDEKGAVMVSSKVSETVRRAFGLDALRPLSLITSGNQYYLKYHRSEIFVP